MKHQPYGVYERFLKRPFDFMLSLLAIIILSPIMLIIALLVRIKLGSPVLFCQERPGKDEIIFKMYKFRSMNNACDKSGNLLSDKERLTKFGRILRSTSLDELPELINILKGDMSIVGPRPLLVQYLSYYNEEQKRRHDVRPGLTGLAQATADRGLSWEKQFELDLKYKNKITLYIDISIILKTIYRVFHRGKNEYGSYIREPFSGDIPTDEAKK